MLMLNVFDKPKLIALFLLLLIFSSSLYAQKFNRDWIKPSDIELRKLLSHEQYTVTQNGGTEQAFRNAYWNNKAEGIYVDIVSGEPLFSSTEKFVSGTGWPSFYKPLNEHWITKKEDWDAGFERVEVRSKLANSHLGHVFDDGPDADGLRYCINSASLRFIAKDDLGKQGYKKYIDLFVESKKH